MRALDLEVLLRIQELSGETARTMFFTEEHLAVRLSSFHGIELEEWPAQIAATALHLVEHQANQAMELALGSAPEPLPLDKIKSIVVGNALRIDWATVVEPSERIHVMGNPPFLGHYTRSSEQADDLRLVWRRSDIGHLDYVTGWYAKAMELFEQPGYDGKFAFVSTNSITQGEPVPDLFRPVFDAGWRVQFAHRTFAWTSEAPDAASVHCAIVGFDRRSKSPVALFDYAGNLRGEPVRLPVTQQINGYLIDGPIAFAEARRSPLSPALPAVMFGSMANDGGHFFVGPEEYHQLVADPIVAKYLRPFVGARELIHGTDRWCLWLADADPSDISRSPTIKERVEAVRALRAASNRAATRALADTPHLFGERRHRDVTHLAIPRHVSETRRYWTVQLVGPETIVGDANFMVEDPDGFAFGVISSAAFIAWQRAVGGRIKSDLRFSSTLTWNTLPLPELTDRARAGIIAAGGSVLAARGLHPHRSLADHYNPLAMTPELLRAHRELDSAVDKALGLRGQVTGDARLRGLFANYTKLTTADELAMPKKRPRKATAVSAAS